ncbi:MAG: carnitine 3-dehydrogenase [Gaiellales bacterium]|nr:carnitine 3-dehydrogenase [Gaiellales bacterium]
MEVGLLGGGVIGGGWAARFALNGIDVRIHDPDPEAERKISEVVANARRAYTRLTHAPLPAEGAITLVPSLEDAVEGVALVQESAPEREQMKRALLARACRAAPPDAIIASSTSGLLPTKLQAEMSRPQRFCVGHPFNPVYLLPLVEVCGGEQTDPETLRRAADLYGSVGLQPLLLSHEIDGFVADRLLEALWREALWLVNDGTATVSEIDDAISYGAGLRWASMGTFLTYRIAGGEAGMRHFMEQFGPALAWPWTKLTEVPELTEALLDRIVEQSDAQAAGRSVRELERLRDDCLVAVMQGLRARDVGAGAVLARWERSLSLRDESARLGDGEVDSPLRLYETTVPGDWIDYNGHVNDSRYLQAFGEATDALLRGLGVDAAYVEAGASYYTVETHLSHLGAAFAGDHLTVSTQVVGVDAKRLHLFHVLERAGDTNPLATAEQMLLHVDAKAQRAAPAPQEISDRARRVADAHASLPRPDRLGRAIRSTG